MEKILTGDVLPIIKATLDTKLDQADFDTYVKGVLDILESL